MQQQGVVTRLTLSFEVSTLFLKRYKESIEVRRGLAVESFRAAWAPKLVAAVPFLSTIIVKVHMHF
jgi:hypothetical protein